MRRLAGSGAAKEHFALMVGAAVALGAVIRLAYVLTDDRVMIGGDAFPYHFEALRLADGLGYTSSFGDVGAPLAHHPPGWVTVLGVVSWFGGRSLLAHQLVGVGIGLGLVLLAGLIGRRYVSARVGGLAAMIAAIYPGFWVIEANVLSEPLGLLLLGCFTLGVIDLRDRPTLRRSLVAGALCGLLALVRSEQLALLLLVVAPVLLRAQTLSLGQRGTRLAAAVLVCGAVIAPWAIYNSTRFEEPVLLSTNDGGTLLAGNCPPATYEGDRLGYFDESCGFRLSKNLPPGLDRSERDPFFRDAALDNIADNLVKAPVVVPARFGRLLAVFRPAQTVRFTAEWMTTDSRPIWAWVVSYWLLIPLAIAGTVTARRSGRFLLPLLAPLLIVGALVAVAYGEPRYHTPADLGVVVLAAVGVERLLTGSGRPPSTPAHQHLRLPSVHVPG